jgi:hypothetical protein
VNKGNPNNLNGAKIAERDFLPFKGKILKFAEQLDSLPGKPVYKLDFTHRDFESRIDDYHKSIKSAASKLKFLMRSKTMRPQKNAIECSKN